MGSTEPLLFSMIINESTNRRISQAQARDLDLRSDPAPTEVWSITRPFPAPLAGEQQQYEAQNRVTKVVVVTFYCTRVLER